MENKYKSPLKKLLKVFEIGRDQWKEKTLNAKYALKIARNRIKFLETSKTAIKHENKELQDAQQKLEHELKMLKLELANNEERKKKLQTK